MGNDTMGEKLAGNLAGNLRYLRQARGLTQARLAAQSDVPRSTLANVEAGGGNPTLAVLARLSLALQVSIEELLSTPRALAQHFPKGSLPSTGRGPGKKATVHKLLPDPVPGMEIDRMELGPNARFTGIPHRPGTREYLYCERGELVLWAGGDRFELRAGDVVAFQGDQKHSYSNESAEVAVAFSVVALVPISAGAPA
ncbi:MAG: DNA-binding protein [Myxococcales bacterium]|nr:DNA-binding protein [Myxococcales bacterium]